MTSRRAIGRARHRAAAAAAVVLLVAAACDGDDADRADNTSAGVARGPATRNEAGTRIELPPTSVTVMSFNVWLGGGLVDIGKVAEAIVASGADVVGLQESDGNARRIADLVGWPHVDEQLQVISRYPLYSPPEADGYTYVQLAPGQVMAIANIHLPSDPYGPYLVRDGAPLDEVLTNEADTRLGAFEDLAAGWAPALDAGIPFALTGDFNAPSHRDWTEAEVGDRPTLKYAVEWPVSQAVEAMGFVDTYRSVHPYAYVNPGITWTFGYPYPRLNDDEAQDRIDFVYVSGADEVTASGIAGPSGAGDVTIPIDPYPSDHLGVVSTIVVDPAEPAPFVAPDELRVEAGDPIGVYYATPGGLDTDRIVLVPSGGDPASDGLASIDPAEAGYFGRVTLGTGGWSPGAYDAVLTTVDADGNPVEVSRASFWIVERGARPSVSVSATVAAGEPIEVAWAHTFARKFDWIGIYSADDPDVYGYWAFAYTERTVDGSYTFGPDDIGAEMLPPGDYVARLMSDDSYVSQAEVAFSVE